MMLNNTLNYDAPSNTKNHFDNIKLGYSPNYRHFGFNYQKNFFFKKSKRYKVSMINLKICFPEKAMSG